MLRVIFDTNIYGYLIKESNIESIKEQIEKDKDFIVYGYTEIRKEIRNIPKKTKLSKKARILILGLYDKVTGTRILKNSIKISILARKYYDKYRANGGNYGWDTSIRIDFMVVACATFNNLDVVYSSDKKTLSSKHALKAYKQINIKENLRTPNFLSYNDLLFKLNN